MVKTRNSMTLLPVPDEEIIITNPEKTEKILAHLRAEGSENFHLAADFDKTLNQAYVRGRLVPSIISILRDNNYLTPDYGPKAKTMYVKYSALEHDESYTLAERKALMHEWYKIHYELLIHCKLNKKDLDHVINESGYIKLRGGVLEIFHFLNEKKIPIVIISAGGLGEETIQMCLQKNNLSLPNIKVVCNDLNWSKSGELISYTEPIIHSLNKNEQILSAYPWYGEVIKRRNIMVLGDNIADAEMVPPQNYNHLLKVGILIDDDFDKEEKYRAVFDIIIKGDNSLDFIYRLLKNLF